VLVSSHNVDDTRHADRVGFLRAGRLLAEGTAESLCTQYNCRSLEAVFTSLCLQDDQSFLPIVRKMNQKSAASTVNQDDDDFRHFEAVSESSSSDGERPDREAGKEKNSGESFV
jgi:ABC-type multidrug transport system ATPase subunit